MCRLLGVSKSGYYCWRDRPPSARALSDDVLTEKIRLVHTQSRQTYGYRRIRTELVEEHDEEVGRHRVARLMHSAGLQGVTRRKFCRTTRPRRAGRPAPDLMERDFTAPGPGQRWVADIAYVPTWAGFLFLAVVLDVFTRRVVGLVDVFEPEHRARRQSPPDGHRPPASGSCRGSPLGSGMPIHEL